MESIIRMVYQQTLNCQPESPATTALLNQIRTGLEQSKMPPKGVEELYDLILQACGLHATGAFTEGFKWGFQFANEITNA